MTAPAAWKPDPSGRHELRYWDGEQWTEHVADRGEVAQDALVDEYPPPLPAPPGGPAAQGYRRPARTRWAALSLGFGIGGIVVLGVVLGTIAVVFGVLALRDIRRDPALQGRSMAIWGIVLGVVGFVGSVLTAIVVLS